ncbi:hypothetical protein TSAR_006409 [Trichomalopsis sarcophagae]|uniref:PDZ domain-containing protein n=1 Tax=Trichomalopsis sarcophagae TaxID=543379 RepID=A0A232F1D6_9HYME|nr:hypothetical protein TSAR_006409 [Trichomalopsis sarcophagae]
MWVCRLGKHLVLVTDPEIVDEAYAFDNPCFKDSATPAGGRSLERQTVAISTHNETHHHHHNHNQNSSTPKDSTQRWSTPWANLGKQEKRRTLDDSCLGPKAAARVSVVQLRSRDFTGLGFNVCGNMREGIFVKDLLHRGPASESGRIHPGLAASWTCLRVWSHSSSSIYRFKLLINCVHPSSGDRISSVKISFRSMVYEDALTILSYASPYDVELEVESGTGTISKPSTLLKKSVGPSPTHICHPLYRSQSIPDLSNSGRKNITSKRLFAAEPNDSNYSNYSTMNSTLKSTKSTPGTQTLERRHEELKANNLHQQSQPKFGIKVLPALDGTVHRIENQNEHNTNLERRHSKKLETVGIDNKRHSSNGSYVYTQDEAGNHKMPNNRVSENLQQRSAVVAPVTGVKKVIHVTDGIDVPDRAAELVKDDSKAAALVIPSEVPAEVHNAAMAARRNRKSSNMELADVQKIQQQVNEAAATAVLDTSDTKSPQKGKRKAPAPPSRTASTESNGEEGKTTPDEKTANGVSDHKGHDQTINYVNNAQSTMEKSSTKEDLSKEHLDDAEEDEASKTDSKMLQDRVKRINANNRRNSESDTDSELQNNSFTTIELNPSDITVHHTPVPEIASKDQDDDVVEDEDGYRKAASLGDLSKYNNANDLSKAAMLERAQSLDMTDSSNSKKRKAPMPPPEDIHESTEDLTKLGDSSNRKLKKSSEWGTLEDAIWSGGVTVLEDEPVKVRKKSNAGGSLERSKSNVEIKSTDQAELSPEPLNVSDGAIETSLELYNLPLSKKLTQEFIQAERLFDPAEDNALARLVNDGRVLKSPTAEQIDEEFRREYPLPDIDDEDPVEVSEVEVLKVELGAEVDKSPEIADSFEKAVRYFDLATRNDPIVPEADVETKVQLPENPEDLYAGKKEVVEEPMSKVKLNYGCPGCDHDHGRHSENCTRHKKSTTDEEPVSYHQTIRVEDGFETHFAKPILNLADSGKSDEDDDEDSKPPSLQQHNVSNVSVSSGESSEDSGLAVRSTPQKMTYITEIQVSPMSRDGDASSDNEEIVQILENSTKNLKSPEATSSSSVTLNVTSNGKLPAGKKPPVPPRRSDATKQVVYVSEYKSPEKSKEADGNNKFENWVFLKDTGASNKEKKTQQQQEEINPWGNGSSPSQPVTNIVLSSNSADEKILRK